MLKGPREGSNPSDSANDKTACKGGLFRWGSDSGRDVGGASLVG
jgi:hypothetical protein